MRSRYFKYYFITLTTLLCGFSSIAQTQCDTLSVYFKQSKSYLDLNFDDNHSNLDSLTKILRSITDNDSICQVTGIKLVGTASPEGPVALNDRLSTERINSVKEYIKKTVSVPTTLISTESIGRDWNSLYQTVASDPATPAREDALETIKEIIDEVKAGNPQPTELINHLHDMNDGKTYAYIYNNFYPSLRSARMNLEYTRRFSLTPALEPEFMFMPVIEDTGNIIDINYKAPRFRKPFYMALKTNLLYDMAALPNIAAEFYLGKKFSIGANWMYGWWDNDNRHRYWRAYGGDIAGRWWFGTKAQEKPLTWHHIGIFGGVVTYDFELGGQGYMGGKPGRTLWDRCNFIAGIEYGYSLPLGSRLNMDFTIGLGYLGGKYVKYKPSNGRYVWESTHRLSWWGPVKAEVSLVWLLGRGNYNRKGDKL